MASKYPGYLRNQSGYYTRHGGGGERLGHQVNVEGLKGPPRRWGPMLPHSETITSLLPPVCPTSRLGSLGATAGPSLVPCHAFDCSCLTTQSTKFQGVFFALQVRFVKQDSLQDGLTEGR